ncbi:Ig-like domain-containing protein [Hymenobacter glacieicola]|uniref:PKD/Chitinase domain-containing protein n=1 Tax=Hymenobacter glacieicola TaxID=1562124 RepID=A0ABQ1X6S0_9BACT|nr:Ig-like domain-containing protein [Hymenobacter glacieicola]GGG60621.1 hypothetical protein GCM10011378_40790 [Hymenobacter glacieicola]
MSLNPATLEGQLGVPSTDPDVPGTANATQDQLTDQHRLMVFTPAGEPLSVEMGVTRAVLAPNDRYEPLAPTAQTAGTEGQKWYHKKATTNNFDQYQYEAGVWVLRLSGVAQTTSTPAVNTVPTATLAVSAANLILGGKVTLTVLAEDSDGIDRVVFFEGATPLNTVNTAPYLLDVTPATAGTKSYTATAYDKLGAARSTAPQAVQVFASANQLPSVSLSLSNTSTVAGQNVTISAVASDADGQVLRVEFYDASTLIGSDTESPYSITYAPTATGNRQITAKAIDNAGGSRETAAKNLTVTAAPVTSNQSPTVSYSQSVNSVQVGKVVTLSANAADADGTVTRVEFYQGGTKVGEALQAPYSYNFTPTAAGSFTMSAKAFDNAGASTITGGVTLTVTAAASQNATPAAPTYEGFSDTQPGGQVQIVPAPGVPVSLVRYKLPGSNIELELPEGSDGTVTVGNVAGPVQARTVAGGSFSASPSSSSLPFTVYSPPAGNAAPTVTLTASPASVASGGSTTLTATAADSDGTVSKVEFYEGETKLAEDTAAPYTLVLTPASGQHTYTARATDNAGAVTISAPITVTVAAAPVAFNRTLTSQSPADESVQLTADPGTELSFTGPIISGDPSPGVMLPSVGGVQIAQVDFNLTDSANTAVVGRPCAFKYQGVTYQTTFQNTPAGTLTPID